jgi:hypothetical protein
MKVRTHLSPSLIGVVLVRKANSGGWLVAPQHPDPIGEGLAMEAFAEAAGPECIVPGQQAPLRLMGLKVRIRR